MPTDSVGVLATLSTWRDQLTGRLQANKRGPFLRIARVALTLGIVAFLAVQLTRVGWGEILSALPTHPLFYALLLIVYVALPATEVVIYGPLWRVPRWPLFVACARKRVLNEEVLGYSGEVSLYLWAADMGIDTSRAFRTVRDVNIVSSAVSFSVAGLLIGAIVFVGDLDWTRWLRGHGWALGGGLVLFVVIALVALRFRQHVFALPRRQAGRVALLHFARHLLTNAALIAMWHFARPEIGLGTWLTFVTVLVVIERLPLLPSRDLIFVGAGVELSKSIELATAAIASMLLVQSGVFKLLHVGVLMLAPLSLRARPRPERKLTANNSPKTLPPSAPPSDPP